MKPRLILFILTVALTLSYVDRYLLAVLVEPLPRTVICGSILVWSAMTALTSTVQSFFHMALARFGVGAGEAGRSGILAHWCACPRATVDSSF